VLQAFDALPPGGAFLALDVVIDDGRHSNVWGLLMSLDMMMEFEEEGAADYTFEVSADAHLPGRTARSLLKFCWWCKRHCGPLVDILQGVACAASE
jgi:hypothetical protein